MQKQKFFQLIPAKTNIDFIGKYRLFVALSSLLIVASFVLMFTKGFHFGIDFTGGTVMQVNYKEPTKAEAVRQQLSQAGAPDASVVAMDKTDHEYLITAQSSSDVAGSSLPDKLRKIVGSDKIEIPQVDVVGPKVGSELKWSAVLALFYSILLIMIYIWLRFDLKFAPGATAALVHDLILTAGFYVVTGMEFDITAVAALLTIAGYSVNDTIVIYDRVRTMLGGAQVDNTTLATTVNNAINITLSRTLLTSGFTALSVIPVALFCDGPIQAFSQAMLFGILIGSYSTIYIAAPMTISVQRILGEGKVATKRA
jgi:preprotein translocase subunit SecF